VTSLRKQVQASTAPSTEDCVELLRSLQQLTRARRRSLKNKQDAGALMMLAVLEGCPGMRISALAEVLMVDLSAVSRQVSALEARGLIGRIRDEADHRAQLVRLTIDGQLALAAAAQASGSDMAQRVSDWSEADIRLLTGLVRKLADDLTAGQPARTRTHPTRPKSLPGVAHEPFRPDPCTQGNKVPLAQHRRTTTRA